MTGLLSGLSGQFSQRLVVGTLLPVVVFVVAAATLLTPTLTAQWGPGEHWALLGTDWRLELATLVTFLLTGLLYVLNIPLIRLYEGYPWARSWIGRALIRHHQRRLEILTSRERYLGRLIRALVARNRHDPRLVELRRNRDHLCRSRIGDYPKHGSILPTRLGNVIRAFENYPERQFSMSGIDLWPRLAPLLPERLASSIADAKMRCDFMLNASFLSGLLAAVALLMAALSRNRTDHPDAWPLVSVALGIALVPLFYRGSISRARSWGDGVKAAFDLHRNDLLQALGITDQPASLVDERALWREISLQVTYLDPWDGSPPSLRFRTPASPSRPHAIATTAPAELQLTRAVEEVDPRRLRVVLHVVNPGQHKTNGVEIVDFLRPGWELEWNTAKTTTQSLAVEGIDPLRFRVGSLEPGKSVDVTYQTIRREPPSAPQEET